MPFCKIPNDVHLHYITNTPRGDASDLDPDKPSILMIPPNLLDVAWLREQFRDPRLSSRYNLIGIDLRHMGQSKAPFHPEQDVWVDAAELAVFHEVLQLSPCHVFASGAGGCTIAMAFAILFPEKCLSLFMCATPMEKSDEPEWVAPAQEELIELWCLPPDLDSFHLACTIMLGFFFNNQATLELQNELVTWWQAHRPPRKSTSFIPFALRSMTRIRISDQEMQAIHVPTFILQGDMALLNTPAHAHALSNRFPNSTFLEVKGGPEYLSIVPEYASVVNRVYAQFLGGISHPLAHEASPPDPEGTCRRALARLARFEGNPAIAQRDPKSTLSFSRAGPKYVSRARELYARCALAEKDALAVVNERGEPIAKFIDMYRKERGTEEYFKKTRCGTMAAEAVIVTVESRTVLELDPV